MELTGIHTNNTSFRQGAFNGISAFPEVSGKGGSSFDLQDCFRSGTCFTEDSGTLQKMKMSEVQGKKVGNAESRGGLLSRINMSGLKKFGVMVCLGATLFTSLAGAFPVSAFAGSTREPAAYEMVVQGDSLKPPVFQAQDGRTFTVEQVQHQERGSLVEQGGGRGVHVNQVRSEGQIIREAKRYGVSDALVKRVVREKGVEALGEAVDRALGIHDRMDPLMRGILDNLLHGESKVFVFTVSHRDAFIKGRAMGKNVFKEITKGVDNMVESGGLSRQEAQVMKDAVKLLGDLSPGEREVMADVFTNVTRNPALRFEIPTNPAPSGRNS